MESSGLKAANLQTTRERPRIREREHVRYYERNPLKIRLQLGSASLMHPSAALRMRARPGQVRRVASPRGAGTDGRNAWWSLEWSPREKEPPAVGIGGGKLPSCTFTLVFFPSLSISLSLSCTPARSRALDLATRARRSLAPFCPFLPAARSSPPPPPPPPGLARASSTPRSRQIFHPERMLRVKVGDDK